MVTMNFYDDLVMQTQMNYSGTIISMLRRYALSAD